MHDGGWMGMGGIGSYWLVPALIVVLAVFALLLVRRTRDGRQKEENIRLLGRLPELPVAVLGFGLSAVWEFVQSPLYSDHSQDLGYLLRSRLHCAGGDTLILLLAFAVTSLVFRSRQWLAGGRVGPTVLFVALGFAYTVWSEWFNTNVTLSWQYSDSMPRVFGIGLAPLAQWLTIPCLLALIFRKLRS